MQPVKTAAMEDVVADLEFMEVYCFEFPFCVFKKAKLIEYSKTLLRRSNYFQKEFTDTINYPFYAMHIQALIVPRIDRFSREQFQVIVIGKEYSAGDIDIVDLMEYNSVYLLKYDEFKSARLGGPLRDPPLEPKREKVNIKVCTGFCAIQCISTGGHLFLGETRQLRSCKSLRTNENL